MEIDTEKFIEQVKARPVLWDASSDGYRDRYKLREAWASIAISIAPDLTDEKDKFDLARDLQMKWRNLRDSLFRSERTNQERMKNSKKTQKYRYAKSMAFLLKQPRANRNRNVDSILNDEFSSDAETVLPKNDTPTPSLVKNEETSSYTSEQLQFIDENQEFNAVDASDISNHFMAAESARKPVAEDEDLLFFQSLLPTVRKLRVHRKLSFRIGVLTLLQEQLQQDNSD